MLPTTIFDWDAIKPETVKTGLKRMFFRSKTATLEQLACHVSTLAPGERAHEPHRHAEEEMIIVKEGMLEALVNERKQAMGAGSLLFIAPQDLHGVTNAGTEPATYYVIKWWPPGMTVVKK